MPRERLVGSFLIRFTEHGGVPLVRVQDLRTGTALDFETWVAAWAYVDEHLERLRSRRSEEVDAME